MTKKRELFKLMRGHKDGGPESKVYCWGIEVKWLCSVLVLRFDEGSREAFHSHAFNSWSWLLSGELQEMPAIGKLRTLVPALKPLRTYRDTVHKVFGMAKHTWVLTFRGPWVQQWFDYQPGRTEQELVYLTHGRKVL